MMTNAMRFGALKYVMIAFAATAMALAPVGARAADKETAGGQMKFATVDVQQLMTDSKVGKSLMAQLTAKQSALQADYKKAEQMLEQEQEALQKEVGKLSAEEFSNKRTAYQKKVLDTKTELENRKRALEEQTRASTNELRKQITDIVFNLAQAQNIDLVLTRQNVVAAAKSVDITDEALKEMDKKVSEIKIQSESKPNTKG